MMLFQQNFFCQSSKIVPHQSSFKMVIADDQYYKKTLEQRRDILDSPSVNFLCITIIFENTAYNDKFAGPFYPKYLGVMVQYVAKINTEKLTKQIRQWQQKNATEKASKQYFHFRLADEQIVPHFVELNEIEQGKQVSALITKNDD